MHNLLILLLLFNTPIFAVVQNYGANEHNAKWEYSGDVYRCTLKQAIPHYGIGFFERAAGRPIALRFELESSEPAVGTLALLTTPPPWRHTRSGKQLTKTKFKEPRDQINFSGDAAQEALAEMIRGMNPTIHYHRQQGDTTVIASLAAIGIQPEYEKFLRCEDGLYPSLFEDVVDSKVLFDSNKFTLKSHHKKRLNQLIDYIKADKKVIALLIDGRTDIRGFSLLNHRLGKKRVSSIHDYLLENGIDKDQIHFRVRNFGEYKPIASNDTKEGRRQNRSVSITLSMEIPEPDPVDDTFQILTGDEKQDRAGEESIFETPMFSKDGSNLPPALRNLDPNLGANGSLPSDSATPGLSIPRFEVPADEPADIESAEESMDDIPQVNLLPFQSTPTAPLVAPLPPAAATVE
jgi:sodium-type flagellar protein MotY